MPTLPRPAQTLRDTIGPGLIMAGAAIGVSHLVQATRAGAEYGYVMVWLVAAACLFKYPFLEYGPRYAAAMGESLLDGYRRLGTWALVLFGVLTLGTMFAVQASVTAVTAGLAGYVFGLTPDIRIWSLAVLLACVTLLLAGRYRLLDRTMKVIMATLAVATVGAAVVAVVAFDPTAPVVTEAPALLTAGSLTFALALMGWMPIPLDVAVWHSLWTLERRDESGHTPLLKDVQTDFNLGYALSFGIALLFLLLGAVVMYGTGERFPSGAVPFATRLIELYTATLGAWSGPVIGVIALTTMLSTTLAVTDAYPRVVQRFAQVSGARFHATLAGPGAYRAGLLLVPAGALVVITFFADNLTALVDLATVLSFLSAPLLAYMNYRLVCSEAMPADARPSRALRVLSVAGLVFLSAFCALFVYAFFFLG